MPSESIWPKSRKHRCVASLGLAEVSCFIRLLFRSVFLSRGAGPVACHGHTGEGPQYFRPRASGSLVFSRFMSAGLVLSPWGGVLSELGHSQTSHESNFTPQEEKGILHFSYHPLSLAALSSAAFWPFSTADGFMQIWPVIFGHSKYHLAFWVTSRLLKLLTCIFENLPRPGRQIFFLSDWSANPKGYGPPESVTP